MSDRESAVRALHKQLFEAAMMHYADVGIEALIVVLADIVELSSDLSSDDAADMRKRFDQVIRTFGKVARNRVKAAEERVPLSD
jgi:hypothetical protein